VLIDDDQVIDEAGGTIGWMAIQSAISNNTRYEFLQDHPVDYLDFKERYLVRRVRSLGQNRDAADNEILLAYCFCISMAQN